MPDLYSRVLEYVRSTPWAIMPEYLSVLQFIMSAKLAGQAFSREDLDARISAARQQRADAGNAPGTPGQPAAGVAIISVRGAIGHRMDEMEDNSFASGTSTEGTLMRMRRALADPDVGALVFDFDTPGGAVSGVPELAQAMYDARGEKPIVAVVNTLAASAGYWLATQADEIVVSPSGEVGSIGVFAAHQDMSAFLEAEGRKVTLISAGKYKVEGNPFEPLSEEAQAFIQSRVDEYHGEFIDAVARGRGRPASEVRAGFGEGRTIGATTAVAMGMADRVDTIDNVIAQLHADLVRSDGPPAAPRAAERRSAHAFQYDF